MKKLLICLLILLLCGCASGIFGFEKSYRCEPFRWIGGEDGFYTDGIYTSNKDYFPNDMLRQEFYCPEARGFEREIKKRLDYWNKLRHDGSEKEKGGE